MQEVKKKIEQHLPGAQVLIDNFTPQHVWHKKTGDYLSMTVTYAGFKGKNLVEQHQMVYGILSQELKKELHALQLKTKIE